jgi:hypothetical protein
VSETGGRFPSNSSADSTNRPQVLLGSFPKQIPQRGIELLEIGFVVVKMRRDAQMSAARGNQNPPLLQVERKA